MNQLDIFENKGVVSDTTNKSIINTESKQFKDMYAHHTCDDSRMKHLLKKIIIKLTKLLLYNFT